jgi:hypothetical protein
VSFGNCLPKCIITWQRKNKATAIDVIEIDDTPIRIKASNDVLERAVLASRNGAVPGFADEY